MDRDLIGMHRIGKTPNGDGRGVEACRRGHRVLFATAAELFNTLVEARAEKHLNIHLPRLHKQAL